MRPDTVDSLDGLQPEDLKQLAAELLDIYNDALCGYHSLDQDGVFVRINDREL